MPQLHTCECGHYTWAHNADGCTVRVWSKEDSAIKKCGCKVTSKAFPTDHLPEGSH